MTQTSFEQMAPMEIERRSFQIISEELRQPLDPQLAPIILRVIHATADFDYARSLYFSSGAVESALAALRKGTAIITDTTMAMAGINKRTLSKLGGQVQCFIADPEVAESARKNNTTRSQESMIKAASVPSPVLFAIGNAPTALIQLHELIREQRIKPACIIGVPVGFVNVVQSKELIRDTQVPCILSLGRKGGSNVAAAIVNALMYMLERT